MMIKTILAFVTMCAPVCAFVQFPSKARVGLVMAATESATDTLALSLPKPLGLILEENEEGKSEGVYVSDFGESGSALEYAEQLKGASLTTVQGNDVRRLDFDTVMDTIINSPETVDLEFTVSLKDPIEAYAVGTAVTIKVLQDDKEDLSIEAKVGDNLRQVMIDAGVEVYQGMKQKLGNCGGGGSCTFCAVDFIECDGWAERSEYEDQRLAKLSPTARLACLNSIQGPATVQKTKR